MSKSPFIFCGVARALQETDNIKSIKFFLSNSVLFYEFVTALSIYMPVKNEKDNFHIYTRQQHIEVNRPQAMLVVQQM